MSRTFIRRGLGLLTFVSLWAFLFIALPYQSNALNILSYKDTISDSKPLHYANHTLKFTLQTNVAPGGYIEIEPPAGFEIIASSTFAERNVEVYVNGIPRTADSALSANVDQVIITRGSPGLIEYNLNPTTGISSGSQIEIRIGNHTSNTQFAGTFFSTSTGTTTRAADVEPIRNSSEIGTHKVSVNIGGGDKPAYAQFSIAVVGGVGIENVDTTEEIPPYRFNGSPTGEIGGTTLNVELSLETDEFAICKFSTIEGTAYGAMGSTFTNTGLIMHSTIVAVTAGQLNTYYVRCMDDEFNINIDDYIIAFISQPPPSGSSNTDGDVEGSGTGSGNDGTGDGAGSGGQTGSSDGDASSGGSTSGGGGSGGGGGGSSGPDTDNQSGGGFESGVAPYRSGDAEVIISGYAFPGSTVYALVDGSVAQSVRASNNGSYSITLSAIARGVYTFGVYAIDTDRIKSTTFSTSFTVTGGRTSSLSNINIMPSIKVTPNPVNPGQVLTISGQAIPNAEITIENQNDKSLASKKTFTTTSNANGQWSLTIDSTSLTTGTYKVRAKAKQLSGLGLETNFSGYTYYGVGQSADVPLTADLNTDGRINLTDFSILLFWWGSDGGNSNPPADINRDGSVSLTDFSIMLFNWTG